MKTLTSAAYLDGGDGVVRFSCPYGWLLWLRVLEPEIVRVTFRRPGGDRLDRTWSIAPGRMEPPLEGRHRDSRAGFACPPVSPSVERDRVTIDTGALRLVVHLDPLRLEWFLPGATTPFAADRPSQPYTVSRKTTAFAHHMARHPSERHYGLGDKSGPLDRTGRRFRLEAVDPMGFDAETSDPLYKVVPVYLAWNAEADAAYGVFYDNLAAAEIDFGCTIDNYHGLFRSYRAEDGDLDYYMVLGPSPARTVSRLSWLTGGQPLPPKWSLGFGLTSMSIADAPDADARISAIIDAFRRTGIPCDSFHFGSGYTTREGRRYVFTWNRDKFPNPAATVDRLHRAGLRVVTNIKPCLLNDHPRYAEAAEAGLFVKDGETGAPAASQFWDGVGAHIDFTNPSGTGWWRSGIRSALLDHGVDAMWNDNNEYEVWDEDAVCDGAGRPFPQSVARPVQALLMTKAAFDQQTAHRPGERPYVVTRAGPPGLARYGQTWTGDNTTAWKTLRFNLRQGLNMGLSGLFNVGHDVGGFAGPSPDPELLVRFTQFCCLWPRFVMNSWKRSGVVTLPWMYPEVLDEVRAAIALRYRLMPYLYTLMWRAAAFDEPPIRPLFYDFASDGRAAGNDDAFMLGRSLLVAPVLEPGSRTREVYLPKGPDHWVDFHTGARFAAGTAVEVDAPLDRLPLLVCSGAMLPVTRQLAPLDPAADRWRGLLVYLSGGAETLEATLYEDDGVAVDWAEAGSCRIHVRLSASDRRIDLGAACDGGYRPPFDHLDVQIVTGGNGRSTVVDGREVPESAPIPLRFA